LGLGLGAGRGDWLDVSFSRSIWQESDLQDAVAILDGGSSDSSQTVTVSTTSGEDAESLDAETENRLARRAIPGFACYAIRCARIDTSVFKGDGCGSNEFAAIGIKRRRCH